MSLALFTVFSTFFVTFVSTADPVCDPSQLPIFVGCMKTELMPNDDNVAAMFKKDFEQGLEKIIFPSGDKVFIDQVQQMFAKLGPDVKQCLKDQTMGKLMGYCHVDQQTQLTLTAVRNDRPSFNGPFRAFQTGSVVNDMETIKGIMERFFLVKLSIASAYRKCNDTNAASATKVGSCLTNVKAECQKVACPAIKKCAPTDSACRASFLNLRGQLCSCHKTLVDYATTVVDKARSDKTSSNAALVKMVVEGLHIQDMIGDIKTCFTETNSDISQGLTFVQGLFANLDSDQAAVMLKGVDIKGLLDMAKDVLSALRDNEFCDNPCST